jgi:hypothetical protein
MRLTRGMSGGPAFDAEVYLIGILTSSFDGEGGRSYVSLWKPHSSSPINKMWLPGMVALPTSIYKLSQAGLLKGRLDWSYL